MLRYRGLTVSELWRLLKWWFIHIGPRRDITINTFNGRLSFNNKSWLIGKYLYVKQNHEEHEIRSVGELLRAEGWIGPGSTVLNVGANIGMTCIALVKSNFFARALAVEPAPENYRLLVRNIEQNGLTDQIQAFPIALSSAAGELLFELSEQNQGDHRVRQTNQPGFYREELRKTIHVQGDTLDHFLAGRKDRIDVIWVDIQGHEGHFIRGGRDSLRKGIPVVTEFWPYGLDRSGTSPEAYSSLLSETFSHFWVIGRPEFQRAPIADIQQLFRLYSGPRNFALVVLAPNQR